MMRKLLCSFLFFIFFQFTSFGQTSVTVTLNPGQNTFTIPCSINNITVECWGAGGAGGGSSTNNSRGGGGGAGGAYASSTFSVTPGQIFNCSIAGATAGTNSAGASGGDTWFSSSTALLAKGGGGGAAPNGGNVIGGAVIAGSIGATVTLGTPGNGGTSSLGAAGGASGTGTGTGGGSRNNSGIGNAGNQPGGGGGGAYLSNNNTPRVGGAGGAGQIRITYTIPATIVPTTENGAALFCTNATTFQSGNITAGQYTLVNVIQGFRYTFSVGNAFSNLDENLTILDATTNGNVTPATSATGTNGATITNWIASMSGQIKVVLSAVGCAANGTVGNNGVYITSSQTGVGNTKDSQNDYGTNNWVGHVYTAGGEMPSATFTSDKYLGYYNISSESINENFGAGYTCFNYRSDGVIRGQVYTEGFAVRYKMKTTKSGCYVVTVSADDGIRLSLNGTNILDRWVEQGSTTYTSIIVNLDGDDDFTLDYYENSDANSVTFSMAPFDPNANTITAPATVNFCTSGNPALINGSLQFSSGDANLQNPQLNFQWQLSTDGVNFSDINGATERTYDPPTINATTVRYYRRLVTFATAMTNVNGVKASCTYTPSNVVTVTASANSAPVFPTTPINGTVNQCASVAGQVYSISATNATSYTWSFPSGWVITAGQGTNSVTVTTGTAGGTISVQATNGCNQNANKTLAVTIATPTISSQPSTSTQTICSGGAATTLSVTGTAGGGTATIQSYRWYSNTTNSNIGGTLVATNNSTATTNSYTPSTATAGTLYYYVVITNSSTCTVTSAVSGAITVNSVHTLTAGTAINVSACQNTAMTNITMTFGGGATGVNLTGLPAGISSSIFGNTLTISGIPTVSGVFPYSASTTGNSCSAVTISGTITVGVGNNIITYSNGSSGSVCVSVDENQEAIFTAPTGTYFNSVSFASYGSPTGSCGSFQISYDCHSGKSQSFTESELLGNLGTIRFFANNVNYDDPCVNTFKSFKSVVRYSEPLCSGTIPGQITGTIPTGGGSYVYLWEISTTNASSGFSPAPGTNNQQNYTPTVAVTGNTWFRRIVTSSGICPNVSAVVFVKVNSRPTSTVSGSKTICNGENATVSVAFTGTAPWNISYTYGAISGSFSTSLNPYTATVNPNITTTYAITGLSDANCTAIAADMTGSAVITVKQIQATPTIVGYTDLDCVNSGTVTLGNLPAGAWQINQTGQATATINGSGTPYQITGLAAGNYTFTVQTATTCVSSSVSRSIADSSTSTWNGSTWVGGTPDSTKKIVIASGAGTPFPTGTSVVNGCSLTINTGIDVTVQSGVTLVITNAVTTNGTLTFENNSSLVQTTNVANTGSITYKRLTSVRRYDLTYWSIPVTNSAFRLNTLSPGTLSDKYYTYDDDLGWVVSPNGMEVMQVGLGYSVRAPQTFSLTAPEPFTAEFKGIPNNGNIAPVVKQGRFNLVGNPYPSAINATALYSANANLGTIYLWTHNILPAQTVPGDSKYYYASDDFASFNLSGGAGGALLNGLPFQGIIAAGQGFIAEPKTATMNFNNSMRVNGSNTQFYKTDGSGDLERNRLWLKFSNDQGAYKQMLVGYIEGATNNNDINYDAVSMESNTYVDFYSINESQKLTIQGRALPFENTDVVPLGYRTTIAGEFTIAIDYADGFFDTQEVYLEDLVTDKIINLRTQDYKFTTAIGTFANRFNLRYTSKTLGTGEFENLENTVLVSVNNKVVKITSSKETIKEVNVYNIGGQLLYTKNKVNSSELQISNLNSSDQVLLVKVTLENGHTLTKKVIFSNL